MARLSRRDLLAGLSGLAAISVLAACQPAAPAQPTPAAKTPAEEKPTAAAVTKPTAAPAAPAASTQPAASAAATKPAAPAASAIKRGGNLIVLQTNDFVSMDPIHASGPTARPCYDSLLAWRPGPDGVFGVQPMLATSWEPSGNKVVFKLREGVKFHDGSDLNADVVVWNLKRMVQNPKSFAAIVMKVVDKENPAQAIDPMTVQLNLTHPSGAILSTLSDWNENTMIVSKKAADDHGEEWLKLNPVGTGAFSFVSYASGDKLVVKKNPNYWMKGADGQPLPYVDGLTIRVVVEATTQFNEMRAGTADCITNVVGRNVPAAKQIAHARYIDGPYSGVKRQYFFNALKPPFKDNLKLRQAIQHAIDPAPIAKALGVELGVVNPYEFVPGEVGFDKTVPFYEFNLDKAKALLKESGVKLPLPVRMVVHTREVDQQQAQLIQAMLAKVDVNVNIDLVERTAWGEKVRIQNDFEMATRQTNPTPDEAAGLLITWAEDGNSAYHRGKVPGLMDVLKQADAEYDAKKRHDLFKKAQTLMYESAYMGYLWYEQGNFVVNKRIQNFPDQVWIALRQAEWWISA